MTIKHIVTVGMDQSPLTKPADYPAPNNYIVAKIIIKTANKAFVSHCTSTFRNLKYYLKYSRFSAVVT